MKQDKRKLFGSGVFYGNALKIAVPIMLQQLIQNLVSLIDNFMVSGLGDIQAFIFKLIMGIAAFIPFLLVCIVFPRKVLSLMLIGNTEADLILDEAVKYMNIMFFTGLPMTFSVCTASSLRDLGKVKIPLAVTIAATATNTLASYIRKSRIPETRSPRRCDGYGNCTFP